MSLKDDINKRIAKLLSDNEKKIERLISSGEIQLIENYKAALNKIKSDIAAMYEKYGVDVSYADMVAYQRLTNLEKQIASEIKLLTKEVIIITEQKMKEIFQASYYQTGFAYETSVGVNLYFGKLDPQVIRAALYNPMDKINWLYHLKNKKFAETYFRDVMQNNSNNYFTKLRSELMQGLIQGKGYVPIAQRYTELTNMSLNNSLRIMRTEGGRNQSAANHIAEEKVKAAADRLGIEMQKIWISTLDDRTRDQHQDMDGREADEDGYFTLPDGTRTLRPKLTGVAEHDINCRCEDKMQIKELTSRFRRDNISKEVITNISYHQWADLKGIDYLAAA